MRKMKIYPKVSGQDLGEEMKERVRNSEGIEIQFFNENGITSEFNFENEIRKKKAEFPNLKEIIVHPPLCDYNIELIIMKDENIIRKQFKKLKELSEELDIDLDMVYHTYWPVRQYVSTGLDNKIKELLKILEGTKVTLLIENIYMMLDEKEECSAIDICKHLDHPNARCCLDTTHLHCKANIYKTNFYEMIERQIDKEAAKKHIKQIHFAAALNGDGYINSKTHGRKHDSLESLREEYSWLVKLGLKDKNYITEIGEEDYYTRKDQLQEIEWLETVVKENI